MTRRPTLPSSLARLPRRATCLSHPSIETTRPPQVQQQRAASYIPRPLLPPQFTQLVRQSDGATLTWRTSSPLPLHATVSQRDSRNHPLWQPSDASLRGIEADEAGRLRAFRGRYGRGWDLTSEAEEDAEHAAPLGDREVVSVDASAQEEAPGTAVEATEEEQAVGGDSLGDLISSYAATDDAAMGPLRRRGREEGAKKEKKKKRRGFM